MQCLDFELKITFFGMNERQLKSSDMNYNYDFSYFNFFFSEFINSAPWMKTLAEEHIQS